MDNDDLLTELVVREYQSRRMRHFQIAESYTRRIIEVVQGDSGSEHRDLCQWYGILGGHLIALERYSEAESSLNLSLRIGENGFGESHPMVARTLLNLGLLYSRRGVHEKAEEYYKRSLQIEEGQDEPDSFWLAQSLSNLGSLYAAQNKLNEANLALARALALLDAGEPTHQPVQSRVLNNLGMLALRKRDYTNAESLFRQALELRESAIEFLQIEVLESMSNLVSALEMQRRTLEATAVQERLRAIVEQEPELMANGTLANVLFKLSSFYDELGLVEEAGAMLIRWARISAPEVVQGVMKGLEIFARSPEPATRALTGLRLLRLREEVLGVEHPDVYKSVNQLVEVYRLQGRESELLNLYVRSIELSKILYGAVDLETARRLDDYGLFELERKNYVEANSALQESLAVRRHLLPAEHLDVCNSIYHLAFLRMENNDRAGAKQLIRQAFVTSDPKLDDDLISSSLLKLAVKCRSENKIDHALWLAKKALVVAAEEGQGKTILYSEIQHTLGVLLGMQARFDESMQTFLSAIELVEEIFGVDGVELLPILTSMVKLHYSKSEKNMDEVKVLLTRSVSIAKKAYGVRHVEYARALIMLAANLGFSDEIASERLYHEALAVQEDLQDRDSGAIIDTLKCLFHVKKELAKYTEAEEVLRRAISIQQNISGVDLNDHASNEFHYGEFLLELGKHTEGEAAFRRALELWKSLALPERNYYYSACLQNYARHLRRLNRIEEALILEAELQELYAKS